MSELKKIKNKKIIQFNLIYVKSKYKLIVEFSTLLY